MRRALAAPWSVPLSCWPSTRTSWMPAQFNNPANVAIDRDTTAREIIADFPEGLDYLITGVGTGGHVTGCAEALKKAFPTLQVFAVEPAGSSVLSGGVKGLHPLQGIARGLFPRYSGWICSTT